MLEGFAVARSSCSFSNCLPQASVLTSSPSFFSQLDDLLFLFISICCSLFFSSPPLFPSFESCPVKRSVLSLWWYRCCCRSLAPCHILHDPVSTFVFIWHTQTYEPLWHASPVVSCQESPVNAANAAPASITSLVFFQIQWLRSGLVKSARSGTPRTDAEVP